MKFDNRWHVITVFKDWKPFKVCQHCIWFENRWHRVFNSTRLKTVDSVCTIYLVCKPLTACFQCVLNVRLSESQEVDLIYESINVTRMDNHVGPVIIKNCMEEYQQIQDLKEPFVYGRLSDKLPEHLLLMVSVDVLIVNKNINWWP